MGSIWQILGPVPWFCIGFAGAGLIYYCVRWLKNSEPGKIV